MESISLARGPPEDSPMAKPSSTSLVYSLSFLTCLITSKASNIHHKANYLPYGVDFPSQRATGRFTNGKTIVDFIATILGFPDFIPSFLSANSSQILQGVNYASGAAGILDESGRTLVSIVL
uniref:Uncharacterized protein n=1 Tax=Kalanchoe fedtschenkoi TaxID=63787 RepID=A0A7N0RFW8_KALFE